MKNKKTLLIIIVIFALSISILTGCNNEPKTSELIKKLENAYNAQDVDELLNCLEPNVAKRVKGLLDVIGLETESLKRLVPFFTKTKSYTSSDSDDWGTAVLEEISSEKKENDESRSTVTYSVKITYSNGNVVNFDDTIQMVLIEGQWYLDI